MLCNLALKYAYMADNNSLRFFIKIELKLILNRPIHWAIFLII